MNEGRSLPVGSSAFAQVMQEILPPVVEISSIDVPDRGVPSQRSPCSHRHHEEGMMVHGLHHCYKVEGGQCLTSFRCNHDHARVSHGHLEEISKNVTQSPATRRRMSIVSSGSGLLNPEEEPFRHRTLSDASKGRRASVAVTGSGNCSPGKNSPVISPAPKRRGSNVMLHSDELHHVYDQFLAGKRK